VVAAAVMVENRPTDRPTDRPLYNTNKHVDYRV
jgi:hypothetical protein